MIITGNWKMNGSHTLCEEFRNKLIPKGNIVLCPPNIYLHKFVGSKINIGSQDCSQFRSGAYTGDISCSMLRDIGVKYCIIGHSERVRFYQETRAIILEKTYRCIENEIKPIVCVDNNFEDILFNLTDLSGEILIAYEPVSAIGTGVVPKNQDISNVLKKIKLFGEFKTLYGGSVNSKNIETLKCIEGVDGFLVGGASLNADEFNKIIELVNS